MVVPYSPGSGGPYGSGISAPNNTLQPLPLVVHRPAAVLPATAQAPIFRVRGGPVRLLNLLGKNTIATNGTATNLTPVANPASALADVNLATATAVASLGVGTLVSLQGAGIGAALTKAGAVSGLNQPIAIDAGTIDLLTSATNPGAFEWFGTYEPLFPGAYLEPVLPASMRGQLARRLGTARWVSRRSAVMPATAQSPILRVTGGPVLLWALVGRVETAMSATATNLSVVANPTSGLTDVVIGAATAIASLAVGAFLSLQAAGIGSALIVTGAAQTLGTPLIVDTGTIDLLTSATNTGAAKWAALWEPIHPAGRLILA